MSVEVAVRINRIRALPESVSASPPHVHDPNMKLRREHALLADQRQRSAKISHPPAAESGPTERHPKQGSPERRGT